MGKGTFENIFKELADLPSFINFMRINNVTFQVPVDVIGMITSVAQNSPSRFFFTRHSSQTLAFSSAVFSWISFSYLLLCEIFGIS